MYRWRGDASPLCLRALAAFALIVAVSAGPLGPLPNITSSELGIKEGSCAVGDVVYMPGDEFPGSSSCEKCTCSDGGVHCAKQVCEPRPGCKALHRPDHCCPTYQCECEQDGHVYANGEKLVDPANPCRLCYCQGGEVVCRRIACFVRNDCRPRLVPGRCCPEYDNCPLRGVTSIPGETPSVPSTIENGQATQKESVKQNITIKEITPTSEIPITTKVKIMEILPSPSIEVAEYSSSKSPLIPREVTSEISVTNIIIESTERPVLIEVHKTSADDLQPSSSPEVTASSENLPTNNNYDSTPSKFSFSTQDSINSEIYPSNIPSTPTEISETPAVVIPVITKAPVIMEEEDTPYEHNPAFPPIPDDLSVSGNHEEEIIPDQNMDSEHMSSGQDVVRMASVTTSSEAPTVTTTVRDVGTTTVKEIDTTTVSTTTSTLPPPPPTTTTTTTTSTTTTTTEKTPEIPTEITTVYSEATTISKAPSVKEESMLNLRSAIPTEILNTASLTPEDITGELDDNESTTTQPTPITTINDNYKRTIVVSTEKPDLSEEIKTLPNVDTDSTDFDTTTKMLETELTQNYKTEQEPTTSLITKSNIEVSTEVTSQTEFSSLPVETSDQNPHEAPDNDLKDRTVISTTVSPTSPPERTEPILIETEIAPAKTSRKSSENLSQENVETTEFILTPLGSSESATDAVELIKISPNTEKSSNIIESAERNTHNVLTELINLVGDVASISDHSDGSKYGHSSNGSSSISDSEELIPVNAGYKSKNNNYNVNSITEITPKSKNQVTVNKQKVIEIEGEDDDGITDAAPPNDKVEPTTRRPIIDNVSDDMAGNKTDKTDIEIIKQQYVPTVERRPTKVVMKKNEKSISEETLEESNPVSQSAETATETRIDVSSETATSAPDASSEAGERIDELAQSTASTAAQ